MSHVSVWALLPPKQGLAHPHSASIMPHKSQLAYISDAVVNVGHVALIMMQTSNHYFSAQSASCRRQASADGLFSVVFFLFLFFKLDLLILPGNLCWILFIIAFLLLFFFFAQS